MSGWMMKPGYSRCTDGGDLRFGPVQINWYNGCLRIHFTWPFRTPRTVTLWQHWQH